MEKFPFFMHFRRHFYLWEQKYSFLREKLFNIALLIFWTVFVLWFIISVVYWKDTWNLTFIEIQSVFLSLFTRFLEMTKIPIKNFIYQNLFNQFVFYVNSSMKKEISIRFFLMVAHEEMKPTVSQWIHLVSLAFLIFTLSFCLIEKATHVVEQLYSIG